MLNVQKYNRRKHNVILWIVFATPRFLLPADKVRPR